MYIKFTKDIKFIKYIMYIAYMKYIKYIEYINYNMYMKYSKQLSISSKSKILNWHKKDESFGREINLPCRL